MISADSQGVWIKRKGGQNADTFKRKPGLPASRRHRCTLRYTRTHTSNCTQLSFTHPTHSPLPSQKNEPGEERVPTYEGLAHPLPHLCLAVTPRGRHSCITSCFQERKLGPRDLKRQGGGTCPVRAGRQAGGEATSPACLLHRCERQMCSPLSAVAGKDPPTTRAHGGSAPVPSRQPLGSRPDLVQEAGGSAHPGAPCALWDACAFSRAFP